MNVARTLGRRLALLCVTLLVFCQLFWFTRFFVSSKDQLTKSAGGKADPDGAETNLNSTDDVVSQQENRIKRMPTPKLFTCGYLLRNLSTFLFPEFSPAGEYTIQSQTSFTDILLYGMHGPCSANINSFQGKTLFVNGESDGNVLDISSYEQKQLYQMGGPVQDSNHTIRAYYATLALMFEPQAMWPKIFDHTQRQKWSGNRSRIAFLVSKCKPHRQKAAAELASHFPMDALGHCTVPRASHVLVNSEFSDLDIKSWPDNWKVFHHYKYCLVMENRDQSGYITEKIIMAFLGGCLPIYWGTQEVFEIFNRDAFLFYKEGKTVEQIQYLEQNLTAYFELLSEPVLANGSQTIRDYFSFTDQVGSGHMKRKIRAMLGLAPQLT